MSGPGIDSAVRALGFVADNLLPEDYVSLSLFGNSVKHLTRQPFEATAEKIGELMEYFGKIEANMGGTELASALKSTLTELKVPKSAPNNRALLLITDCQVAGLGALEEIVSAAGVRFFSLGVGLSPVDSYLRVLADKTGGSVEFATPGEEVGRPINRLFQHIRTGALSKVMVDWGGKASWESETPKSIFSGGSLNLFAFMEKGPKRPPTLSYDIDGQSFRLKAGTMEKTSEPSLARLAGAARVALAASLGEETLRLALKYQLVTDQTNLVLVHERIKDKAEGIPFLQAIPQMSNVLDVCDCIYYDYDLSTQHTSRLLHSESIIAKNCVQTCLVETISKSRQGEAKSYGGVNNHFTSDYSEIENRLIIPHADFTEILKAMNEAAEKLDGSGKYQCHSFHELVNSTEVTLSLIGSSCLSRVIKQLSGLRDEEAKAFLVRIMLYMINLDPKVSQRLVKLLMDELS
jgi:hypothetical protein